MSAAKTTASLGLFQSWREAMETAQLRALITRNRYRVTRCPHGWWWVSTAPKRQEPLFGTLKPHN